MREATRDDLPRGSEAQCPICWRIFGSDSTCERHKPYRRPVSAACKDPADIGLQSRERRGLAVWVLPMSENVLKLRRARNQTKEAVMREPFEGLLGQFHDHPILGPCLEGQTPDFTRLKDERIWSLSSGERILCHVALAIKNGDPTARIADLADLDTENRRRVLDALTIACDL